MNIGRMVMGIGSRVVGFGAGAVAMEFGERHMNPLLLGGALIAGATLGRSKSKGAVRGILSGAALAGGVRVATEAVEELAERVPMVADIVARVEGGLS